MRTRCLVPTRSEVRRSVQRFTARRCDHRATILVTLDRCPVHRLVLKRHIPTTSELSRCVQPSILRHCCNEVARSAHTQPHPHLIHRCLRHIPTYSMIARHIDSSIHRPCRLVTTALVDCDRCKHSTQPLHLLPLHSVVIRFEDAL